MGKLKPGTCNAGVTATIVVTEPLQHAVADGGAKLSIDKLSGSVIANGGASVIIADLAASGSNVTIGASGGSPITVTTGHVQTASVTANGGAPVKLGSFVANEA